MTDKQINKWLRRQFSPIGWLLVVYYGLMNVFILLAMFADMAAQALTAIQAGQMPGNWDLDAIYSNAWGYLTAIFVAVAIYHAWKGSGHFREIISPKAAPMTSGSLFCLVSLCIGTQMVNVLWISLLEVILNFFGISALSIMESVSGSADSVSMFLYASFAAPIFEEVLFRGVILRSLQPYGRRFAILGSAILFGLFHGNLLQTPYAILMGLILGYIAVEHSLIWAVGLHMFNNLVLADLLSRLTMGLSDTAYTVFNCAFFGGFAVVSAVILFNHRQEIRSYHRSSWIDKRCLKQFCLSSGFLALAVLMLFNMLAALTSV